MKNRTGASPGTFFTVSGTARMVPAEVQTMLIGRIWTFLRGNCNPILIFISNKQIVVRFYEYEMEKILCTQSCFAHYHGPKKIMMNTSLRLLQNTSEFDWKVQWTFLENATKYFKYVREKERFHALVYSNKNIRAIRLYFAYCEC